MPRDEATLYLVRGETGWMLSLRKIPEDEDRKPRPLASSPTTVLTAIPLGVEMDAALRAVQDNIGTRTSGS